MALTYLSNPWEAWAYKVGEVNGDGRHVDWGRYCHARLVDRLLPFPFLLAVGALSMNIIDAIW